jgi:hypothetical protein
MNVRPENLAFQELALLWRGNQTMRCDEIVPWSLAVVV